MDTRIKTILEEINSELGGNSKLFNIEYSETLTDEPDNLAVLISFTPKSDIEVEDGCIDGKKQHLEFCVFDEGEICLIVGEDTELALNKGNIFACLYWGEVIKSA